MFSRGITLRRYHAPCGELLLGCHAESLCLCDWTAAAHHARLLTQLQQRLRASAAEGNSSTLQRAIAELDAYFAGQRQHFETPLLFAGTPFQQRVWQALTAIPFGETLSYGGLAQALGMPLAARAVANAVGANALSLFIPCHRVIRGGGAPGGYAGGHEAKRFLLRLEQAQPLPPQ